MKLIKDEKIGLGLMGFSLILVSLMYYYGEILKQHEVAVVFAITGFIYALAGAFYLFFIALPHKLELMEKNLE